jgi:hypothetical protein
MIVLQANLVDEKLIPERELTQEEKASIIAMIFTSGVFTYYQIGEGDALTTQLTLMGLVNVIGNINDDGVTYIVEEV